MFNVRRCRRWFDSPKAAQVCAAKWRAEGKDVSVEASTDYRWRLDADGELRPTGPAGFVVTGRWIIGTVGM